jgi:hypothetical protein
MISINSGVLALVAVGAWWLTGLDKAAGGESKRTHYAFRTIRCAAILWLAGMFLWLIEDRGGGPGDVALLLIIPPALALLLRSSVAEGLTHGLLQLIDPNLHDDRAFDPGKSRRYLDTIAHLIQNGRREEAVRLCEEFKQSGEVDRATLEMTLEFLGVPQKSALVPKPLAEARQLRAEGKFAAAEMRLQSQLAKNPADAEAAMLLVRLYAQDLRQPGKAQAVLRKLEQQPQAVASHIEFARRSIDEWSKPESAETRIAAPPKSVDELAAQGFLGTAIEKLEAQTRAQPDDFEGWLKLAEIHAVHCKDFRRAQKIIQQLGAGSRFTPQQIESAWAKLKNWREA